ncbi:cation transporter [Haloferax mediterranei ATCC 33500]|uniref:Cation efflux protein n=1 Tax=Haloferax mediterranei (strain ATCC 33500 / DSM 1411 / JCM 8866 / NBRC 14739 / NCIMB 2177 / R-4) TaxID=523841 RepID=I3R180_HALMT|nr:cation diffusion facilitator family transporter [Haloferax mediterranei]AFK17990.1 cation efflux protein [Haloferax mediterranei ATCC 33500]AHZ22590.1 cation transporter [Haloferax mediterranei ATCC 33500]EMA02733.1 cation efflux protein [Haloferax mediterranei ATCC 33500]MDX5988083.1 cation diffusion facilitator family transporter [Haloferax mediterranei ATCC 33500]QCQ74537.1 cation transporter [Haloferax mediterranei ATCC 33500]
MAGSTSVVIAALFANGAIAVLKFLGFLATGSPSMLSETYHSISDTGNQVFLLIGIRYSRREETREHPFGFGKAQFFYSFLVSVMLFGIAGWESAKHGYNALMHPSHSESANALILFGREIEPVYVNVAILLGAIAFESYAFLKANAELRRQIEEYEWSGLVQAFRETSDVTTLTAFTEDTVALGGAVLALAGIGLTELTGNEAFDAAAALLIGILLMGFAIALAWENKRLLIGESIPLDEEQALKGIVRDDPHVSHVDRFRASYVGPEKLLLALNVSFDSELGTEEIDDYITEIENELKAADDRVHFVYIEPEL